MITTIIAYAIVGFCAFWSLAFGVVTFSEMRRWPTGQTVFGLCLTLTMGVITYWLSRGFGL